MAGLGPGAGVKNNQFGALMNRRKNLEKLVLQWDGVGTGSGSGMWQLNIEIEISTFLVRDSISKERKTSRL